MVEAFLYGRLSRIDGDPADRYYSCSDSFNCRAGAHPRSVCALSSAHLILALGQRQPQILPPRD
ncbi:MAG: hypothetical protein DMF03_08985 [Verrucomicrobia bacterium]|nr:MAG: hypothetical protein DMF03_08985 [Verrucomicrobiota bacterium]